MGHQSAYEAHDVQPGLRHIHGRFLTVNGSDPVTTVGRGWTVARTAEGKWTLTLSKTYNELVSVTGSAMLAAAGANGGDLTVHWDPVAANTAVSSLVCYLSQDGNDDDTAGAWVNFHITVRETSVTR